jgi:hypothetical protein
MNFRTFHVAGVAAAALTAMGAAGLAGQACAQAAASLKATMSGPVETPPGDPHGAGSATFKVDPAKSQICYDLHVSKIGAATAAHIHKGGPGEAGPPVVMLTAPDKTGKSSGCAQADAAVITALLQNPSAYYVNVHNAQFPGGAVRGQLTK